MHQRFYRQKCGCHPTNARNSARALRVADAVLARGYRIDLRLPSPGRPRIAAEVYPHPALVRWFDLAERIPYKRGPVAVRREEFARLQALLKAHLPELFPAFVCDPATAALLAMRWTKDIEDQTDALLCALIGYWHWLHDGSRTEIIGDEATGFVLVPQREPTP